MVLILVPENTNSTKFVPDILVLITTLYQRICTRKILTVQIFSTMKIWICTMKILTVLYLYQENTNSTNLFVPGKYGFVPGKHKQY